MSAQERRTEASRKLLIDTALQIIGSDGLRGLTVARLEAVSGASRGLVGYHFGSKRGLLAATIRRAHRIVAASPDLADAGGATDAEATLQIARGYLAQLGRDPRGHRAILALMSESVAAQPQLQEPIWALNAALRDGIGRQRERGLADGSVRAASTRRMRSRSPASCVASRCNGSWTRRSTCRARRRARSPWSGGPMRSEDTAARAGPGALGLALARVAPPSSPVNRAKRTIS